MSERRREQAGGRERDGDRRSTTGPFGTMLGATFGPVGAAVGSVVDETRVAFTFSVGTGVGASGADDGDRGDDGLDDPATIEIEDVGDGKKSGADSGTDGEDAA